MTQFVPLDGYSVTATTAPSKFNPGFTTEEIAQIAKLIGGENVINSPAARLEELRLNSADKVAEFALSETDFFSFLATNVLPRIPASVLEGIEDGELRERVAAFKDSMFPVGVVTTHDARLANALATSLIVEDADGSIVLTERAEGLPVGGGIYGVSATSGVSIDDVLDGAPITGAVAREARQSLGLDIDANDIAVQGVAFGVTKSQPAVLCHVKLSSVLSPDDIQVSEKNKRAIIVSKSDEDFLNGIEVSEVARLHLEHI